MGHPSVNVFNVGPMAVDEILTIEKPSWDEYLKKVPFVPADINYLVTYHSETLSSDHGIHGLRELLKSLLYADANVLFTHPNADEGGSEILSIIDEFVGSNTSRFFIVPSLGQKLYLESLCLFNAVIGNSSSGIIEAPLVGIPVLNIGDRQKGRYKHGYVIDSKPDHRFITSALDEIKTAEFSF